MVIYVYVIYWSIYKVFKWLLQGTSNEFPLEFQ